MSSVRVLILTAVQPEARALARAFHLRETKKGSLWLDNGLALANVGVGAKLLPRVGRLPEIAAPQLVVMAGVAGALSPELRRGDVVLDAALPEGMTLPRIEGVICGRIHTTSKIVATADAKAQLFRKTGCLAVDMEGAAARDFAASRGAIFLSVRGISDAADEALDPRLLTLVDAEGKPRIGGAMAMLSLRPWKLSEMLRLRSATEAAMAAVARTLEAIFASTWASGWRSNKTDRLPAQ